MSILTHSRAVRWALGLAACLMLVGAEPAVAQIGLGGSTGGRGKKPPRSGGGIKLGAPADSGSYFGRILKFSPVENAGDDDLVGHLIFRPFRKDLKTLRLRVHRKDNGFSIRIGDGSFAEDQLQDILSTGLYCTVNWSVEKSGEDDHGDGRSHKRKRSSRFKKKELVDMTFNPVAVEGKIVEIDGDIVVLRCKPKSGDWPEVAAKINPNRPPPKVAPRSSGNRKKKVRLKKLKLKVLEDVTKFSDAANTTIDLGDLEADQPIEANVIQGAKTGYLTSIKLVDAEAGDNEEGKGGDRGGRPGG